MAGDSPNPAVQIEDIASEASDAVAQDDVTQLCQYLRHDNCERRREAVQVLHYISYIDRVRFDPALEPLINRLGDEQYDVRRAAAETLDDIAETYQDPLTDYATTLATLMPKNNDEIVELLHEPLCYATQGEPDADVVAVEALADDIDHWDHNVRLRAVTTIATLGHQHCQSGVRYPSDAFCQTALDPLCTALTDPHADVRTEAVNGLAIPCIVDPAIASQAIPYLADAIVDDVADVRAGSADALGHFAGAESIDAELVDTIIASLETGMDDANPTVRARCISAYQGFIQNEDIDNGVEHLVTALTDNNRKVRDTAALMFQILALEAPLSVPLTKETLHEGLADESCRTRECLVTAFGQAQGLHPDAAAAAIPQFIDLLEGHCEPCTPIDINDERTIDERNVRQAAAKTLGIIGRSHPSAASDAVAPLRRVAALDGPLGKNARRALRQIHKGDPSLVPKSTLGDDEDDDEEPEALFGSLPEDIAQL